DVIGDTITIADCVGANVRFCIIGEAMGSGYPQGVTLKDHRARRSKMRGFRRGASAAGRRAGDPALQPYWGAGPRAPDTVVHRKSRNACRLFCPGPLDPP